MFGGFGSSLNFQIVNSWVRSIILRPVHSLFKVGSNLDFCLGIQEHSKGSPLSHVKSNGQLCKEKKFGICGELKKHEFMMYTRHEIFIYCERSTK